MKTCCIFVPFFVHTNSHSRNGFLGGSPVQAYKMAKRYAKKYNMFVVTLKTPNSKSFEIFENIKIYRIGEVNGNIKLDIKQFIETLVKIRPDLYIQFYVKSGCGDIVLSILPKIELLLKCKTMIRFGMSNDFEKLSSKAIMILNNTKSLLVNKTMVNNFRKFVPNSKYSVVENKCDKSIFRKFSRRKKLLLRKKYNISQNAFVVLFAGRFVRRKGVIDILNILHKFKDLENILFVFVGDDVGDLLKGKQGLKERVHSASINYPKIVKLMISVDHSQMPEIYNLADTFCLPSKIEGMSNSLLEAQSCGLDTLVGDIPENSVKKVNKIFDLEKQIYQRYVVHQKSKFGVE